MAALTLGTGRPRCWRVQNPAEHAPHGEPLSGSRPREGARHARIHRGAQLLQGTPTLAPLMRAAAPAAVWAEDQGAGGHYDNNRRGVPTPPARVWTSGSPKSDAALADELSKGEGMGRA